MKRNIVQTLAFATVLATTIVGVAPTEANAITMSIRGKQYDYNVETQEKREISDSEYKAINDKQEEQSKQAFLQDGWNIPTNLTDISQIRYVKDGKPLSGGHMTVGGHEVWLEADGSLGTGWKQDNQGNWRYFKADGTSLLNGVVDNYVISGGVWDKTSTKANEIVSNLIKNTGTSENTVSVATDSSQKTYTRLTESQFKDYLKQGKIGAKTSYFGEFGQTDISKLTQTFDFYLK